MHRHPCPHDSTRSRWSCNPTSCELWSELRGEERDALCASEAAVAQFLSDVGDYQPLWCAEEPF